MNTGEIPMLANPPRRIVTGHDDHDKAIVIDDGPPPRIMRVGDAALFYEVWSTTESPARIVRRDGEPERGAIVLAPPAGGTRIRVLDFLPETRESTSLSPAQATALFEEIGGGHAATHAGASSAHALMHRTETVDYGIVLDGEIVLVLDEEEMVVRAGDIVVQRGTNHAWANRTDRPCRVAFILIDGRYDGDLA